MEPTDKWRRMSAEKRALLALRLSKNLEQNTSQKGESWLPEVHPDAANRYERFPLSDIQQAYLIGRSDRVELGSISCHSYFEADADWDAQRLEAALQKLIERHEMLRSVVLPDGYQKILQQVPPYRVESIDLRGQEPSAVAARLEAVRREMSHKIHLSDRWPLFDFCISHLEARQSRLHVSIDLLIADGRSLEILFGELEELYRNPNAILPSLELSFRDYLLTFHLIEDTEAFRDSQKYWLKRLSTLPPAPELPLAVNPASIGRPTFKRWHARLDSSAWHKLKGKAAQINVTPSGILLAAYVEVLTVWSKNPQFTINLTLFNRLPLHPQVNDLVGDFTSVNLLEVDNSKREAFESRARRLLEQLWQDLEHRHFSGIRVMRELTRLQGPKAVLPVVFTSLLNIGDGNRGNASANMSRQTVYAITQTPQVYLDCMVHEDKEGLVINWDAVEEVFPEDLLDDMFQGYRRLLEELAADGSSWRRTPAENTLALIPPAQMELRQKVNDTQAVFSEELLQTPFLRRVEKRPNQIAVCTPTRELTYEELYLYACRIEEQLLTLGVKPNQLVAIVMEKGWEQVVAVLGILFAGGAYLPVDPELPAERQRYLLEHGQVSIVLTQSTLPHRLNTPTGVQVVAVDLLRPATARPVVQRQRQKPQDLAYVIYTSGSTGFPKGVMIDHRGALNTVLDINQRFGISPADRVLALSRLSFDLSVYDIFGLLAAGGTIVMPKADLAQDVTHWAELVATEKVTVWNTVPALMQLLVDHDRNGEKLGPSLRLIMMSGDWIPVGLPAQIKKILPHAKTVSLGGATEGSIWSILYPIEQVDPRWKSIPYGRPMLNQTFHVLNHAMAPCPVWVPGCLYIGGIGVAKGYWRDKQKTDASFVTDPVNGARLYRTGDLGRYLPDGNIEFLGREDFQVKVQGYRIELGEIEIQLLEHKAVENCVVVVREDNPGEKRLVGYVVAKPGARTDASHLGEHLRQKLPEYMVPSAFVFLDQFPLTGNGKVDRKALPKPERPHTEASSTFHAPVDKLELQLAKLWEKVLGVHPVGRNDNFFDLGGHSLAAVRFFAELAKVTGLSLPLSTLFQAPTVEKLAAILRQRGWSASSSSLVPIQPGGGKRPFFCVHGGGGNVLLFHDLARDLGSDYPFYGLQSRGVDGSKNYLTTVEEMALHYLKEIRQLQPEGPYYLGGFCMGGQIAYEMAQRLRKGGQRVALLVMIDTYNFSGTPLRLSRRQNLSRFIQKATLHYVNFVRLGPRERRSYLRRKLKGAYNRGERISVKLANLFRIGLDANGKDTHEVFLEDINDEAAFAYVPHPCDQKITVFNPQRNYSFLTKSQMGWNGLTTGGLDIIELPVDPGGIFLEPHVQTLAVKLRALIDEAQQRSEAGVPVSSEIDASNASGQVATVVVEQVTTNDRSSAS